jgi:hypothetical protein
LRKNELFSLLATAAKAKVASIKEEIHDR